MSLEKVLQKHHLKPDYYEGECVYIKIHQVAEIFHSYFDWTGEPEEDYECNQEIMEDLESFINDGSLCIIECDECCGCGDW